MRLLLLTAPVLLAACTSVTPVHRLDQPLRPGEWAWCLAPSGETVGFTTQGGKAYAGATCSAPNRFVRVFVCREGEVPADESPAAWAARIRLSRDNSLAGDKFEGRSFCAPMPPS